MKRYIKWKKQVFLFLSAAIAAGSVICLPDEGLLTAQAARITSPVTEYDEETLNLFRDQVLEYWEIPGLIERYNPSFCSQLEQFYKNPGGSSGLTRQQLLELAEELRAEAEILDREAEEEKEGLTRLEYEDYRSSIRTLKARAKDLEDQAAGKSAAGSSALRALRITRDKLTKTAREQMRTYQTLVSQERVAAKELEIAELSFEAARRQRELGLYSEESLLDAEKALNSARDAESTAQTSLEQAKQSLIRMLGWQYDDDPRILEVPKPELAKLDGYNPEVDEAKAIENNITLFDTRMTSSSSQGGAVQKARTIQEQENTVRDQLGLLYQTVLYQKAAYDAALLKRSAAEADWAAAERKNGLGMLSRQEYLTAESSWLSAEAAFESAELALTGAMEEYEWAVQGLLELPSGTGQGA